MMITQRDSERGHFKAFVTGKLSDDARYEETQFGPKCTFKVNFESWQDSNKKWQNKTISCRCTKELAVAASHLEKKDVVLVTGTIRESTFTDKRTGEVKNWTEIVCDYISPSITALPGLLGAFGMGGNNAADSGFEEIIEPDDDYPIF